MVAEKPGRKAKILSLVARHQELKLERTPKRTGYEARAGSGERFRILLRPSRNRNKSGFSFRPEEFNGSGAPFDYFLGVLYDEDASCFQVVRAPYARLSGLVEAKGQNPRIYWRDLPREDGSVEFLEISTRDLRATRSRKAEGTDTPPIPRQARRYAPDTGALLEEQRRKLARAGAFRPTSLKDAREWTMRAVVLRRGQSEFREALIEEFEGRCAITGCDALDVLEAAHIAPYKGLETNHPANGLLLRADIHTLFDLGLISIDAARMTVIIAPSLANTCYADLAGKHLRSRKGGRGTSKAALRAHRTGTGL